MGLNALRRTEGLLQGKAVLDDPDRRDTLYAAVAVAPPCEGSAAAMRNHQPAPSRAAGPHVAPAVPRFVFGFLHGPPC